MNAVDDPGPRGRAARAVLAVLSVTSLAAMGDPGPGILFRETFDEEDEGTALRDRLGKYENVIIDPGGGPDGSAALRVVCRGGKRGSKGIAESVRLSEGAPVASLAYDVRFEETFDFSRGGKLPGLGPERPVTGGAQGQAAGWSARPMWREEGLLTTYVYHQNQPDRYGEYRRSDGFRLERGRYLAVTVVVILNGGPGEGDGSVEVFVDGVRVVAHEGLELQAAAAEEDPTAALVNRLVFTTFHGGSDASWAPVDEEGRFRDVVVWFDNVEVAARKTVRAGPHRNRAR